MMVCLFCSVHASVHTDEHLHGSKVEAQHQPGSAGPGPGPMACCSLLVMVGSLEVLLQSVHSSIRMSFSRSLAIRAFSNPVSYTDQARATTRALPATKRSSLVRQPVSTMRNFPIILVGLAAAVLARDCQSRDDCPGSEVCCC